MSAAPGDQGQQSEAIEFGRALSLLRRRLPLIIVCAVVVAGAAYAFSKQQEKQYTATAALEFGSTNPFAQHVLGLSSSGSGDGTAQQASNIEIVRLGDLAAKTAQKLGLSESEVSNDVEVNGAGESNVVSVSATSSSPSRSAAIANAYVQAFVGEQKGETRNSFKSALKLVNKQLAQLPPQQRFGPIAVELQNKAQTLRLLQGVHYGNVSIAAPALAPSSPTSPKVKKNVGIGALIGLLIGIGLVFALERLERDRLLRDPEDLELIHGRPLLGTVPESAAIGGRSGRRRRGASGASGAEAFQMIRARLRFSSSDGSRRTILVAAAERDDGATTVARGLAEAAVRSGARTILVETNLREPSLSKLLRMGPSLGLGGVLTGETSIDQAIQAAEISGVPAGVPPRRLDVLVAGDLLPSNAGELLEGPTMENTLAYLRTIYDFIVIDAPPFTVQADAYALLPKVDGVVAVGRVRKSSRTKVADLQRTLEISGAHQLGVIANGVKFGRVAGRPYEPPVDGPGDSKATAASRDDGAAVTG